MDQVFLSKILNYENEIFNKFIENRTNLIKNLKNLKNLNRVDFDNLQLINFVNSFKGITESLKNVSNQIDDYFVNYDLGFNNTVKELQDNNFIIFYFLFKDLFLSKMSCSEELEESDSDTSDSVSVSVSVSESDVSSELSE